MMIYQHRKKIRKNLPKVVWIHVDHKGKFFFNLKKIKRKNDWFRSRVYFTHIWTSLPASLHRIFIVIVSLIFIAWPFFPPQSNTFIKRELIFKNTRRTYSRQKGLADGFTGIPLSCNGWFYVVFQFSQISVERYSKLMELIWTPLLSFWNIT